MSYSTLIPFTADNRHGEGIEFRNAWGLHARIWTIVQRHLGWRDSDWLTKLDAKEGQRLWALHEEPAVPASERIALAATFDRVWVPAVHVPRVAAAFREVANWNPAMGVVCHLRAAARAMEAAVADGAVGIGFHGTSVSDNPWVAYAPDPEWASDDERWDEWEPEPTFLGPWSPNATPIHEVVPDLFDTPGPKEAP